MGLIGGVMVWVSVLGNALKTLAVVAFCLSVANTPAFAGGLFGDGLLGSRTDANADVVDPISYNVRFDLTNGDAPLESDLEAASLLIAKQDSAPSGTVGLVQRARDDWANLVGKLYELGRFGATVDISLDGRPLDSVSVTDTLGAGGRKVKVVIAVDPGPSFTFGRIVLEGSPEHVGQDAMAKAGLVEGEPASATIIYSAADAVVLAWKRQGHPFARVVNQKIIADHAERTVDVTFQVAAGPYATIGEATVSGATALEPDFLLQQAEVPVGAPYHPDIIARIGKNLKRIDALGSAIVKTADHVDADGSLPLLIEVSERPPRTIGVGGFLSTTEGIGGEVFWLHRNLFGAGEKLRLEASLSREITSNSYNDIDTYTGRVGFQYEEPGVYGPRVSWLARGLALQEHVHPYQRKGFVLETGYAYRMTDELTLTGTVEYDWAHIVDAYAAGDFSLLSTPLLAVYDSRDNALDATSGIYARILAEPQYATNSGSAFATGDAEVRAYYALDEDGHFVLAARGKVGTIVGADLSEIPAHRRFYAGGGGSVRGYDYLDIGPSVPGYGPTGGLSRAEGSVEARLRVSETIGIVGFADAGYVTETSLLGGDEVFQMAAGLGLRYYTAVGPLRLDVAVPINPRKGDPNFAVYFGIGQSF
jgi:translocation and assembly module TamA